MITCDGCCNACSCVGDCELILPYHQTLHKLNKSILNTTYELERTSISIQHSLQNNRLNYPIYIGKTIYELTEHQKRLEKRLYDLTEKREDLNRILRRRKQR